VPRALCAVRCAPCAVRRALCAVRCAPRLFVLFVQVDAPDVSLIPAKDLLGVTVVLLTCAYRGQEFIRVGYYVCVSNELCEGSGGGGGGGGG
jgi:hypothetical protein